MNEGTDVKKVFELLDWALNERMRRLLAAAQAEALGSGGISKVSRELGMSRQTITTGTKELRAKEQSATTTQGETRVRRKGAGRKKTIEKDPSLIIDLEKLVDPVTRGDPESPLRWTVKSTRRLADELKEMGHETSRRMVGEILHQQGYSLQSTRKTKEGGKHPDRNAQFEYINNRVTDFLSSNDPAISIDTKKKELVGDFKNGGREWQPKGKPEEVRVYDFIDDELGMAIPYGVYDIGRNEGWVNVGTDHDTSTFAVQSIRLWWYSMGQYAYPRATKLLITADGGGSNGSRRRLWKVELEKLVNELGFPISVCHFPPGTSKWNKIEHRLFSYITQNWRGRPLVSHEVIVSLIASVKTKGGLKVRSSLDKGKYPLGHKVLDAEMASINIEKSPFHGEWNYTIMPSRTSR